MKYSAKAAGATAFGHSTLTPFTRQDARKEIQPKAARTSGTRSTPRCVMSRNAGTSNRHTTDSTVAGEVRDLDGGRRADREHSDVPEDGHVCAPIFRQGLDGREPGNCHHIPLKFARATQTATIAVSCFNDAW